MAAQFDHELPDGTVLHAIDAETSQRYLQRMLWSFIEGSTNPLIVGNAERAQAVVLPPDAWVNDIALQDQRTDTGAEALARRQLEDAERQWQSEEHFSARLSSADRTRADADRPTPPLRELRIDAVDVQIASRYLGDVVSCLESGALDVLFLGDDGVVEGVMIPVDYWLEYLGLEDEDAGDRRIAEIVRERIATPLEDSIDLDDFLREMKGLEEDQDEDRD
jgi:hypothetical protein